uniref:Sec-independent protein translocase component TatC n=1 Tax=Heterosiphonia pulchra TaxID=189631 RepID=UPI002E7A4C37|nr:Sec-independent protein translocase component TatC [Heterosiphonia pulchra]WQF69571.1 Sec-independent protein translocase component TatC [Heterosiphonia pulchra]
MFKYKFLIFYYLEEIGFTLIYLIKSFIICFLLSIVKFYSLICYSSIWILKLTNERLFVLNSFEIFNVTFFIGICYTLFFILPLFLYFLYKFFVSSWYLEQININKSLFFCFINLIFINVIFIFYFVKFLLSFLLFWSFKNNFTSYSIFDIHLTLSNYSFWWISLFFKSLFFISLLFFVLFLLNLIFNFLFFFKILTGYKKILFFFNFLIFSIFILDIYIQLSFIISFIIFYEIFYFFLCYNNINLYFNAYFKTSFKNFKKNQ